jgi:tripartite-type tricarboxylate transporter receptor subunit TctC
MRTPKGEVMQRICLTLLPILAVAVASTEAGAQPWPSRPIRAIVPFTAGSGTDVTARVILNQLSSELGQTIVVENRVGAGGTIGTATAAKADPDGYTILVQSSALTIAPSIYQNLTYDTARDLAAVAPLGISPNVLIISPSRGIKTVHELVSAAKAKPESFTFASAGVGTNTHLSAERFRLRAGFEAVHVAFKGGPEAITEVMAGRVDFSFLPIGIVLSHIREGKLIALAVNGPKRASALPDVPTTLEAGFTDSDYPIWWATFVPAKTPRDVVDKLHRATLKATQAPKVQEKLATMGVDPLVLTPAELDAHVKNELSMNAALVKATGVKAN